MSSNRPADHFYGLLLKEYGELQKSRGSLETNVKHLLDGQKSLTKRTTWLMVLVLGAGVVPEIPWVSQKVDKAAAVLVQAVASLLA